MFKQKILIIIIIVLCLFLIESILNWASLTLKFYYGGITYSTYTEAPSLLDVFFDLFILRCLFYLLPTIILYSLFFHRTNEVATINGKQLSLLSLVNASIYVLITFLLFLIIGTPVLGTVELTKPLSFYTFFFHVIASCLISPIILCAFRFFRIFLSKYRLFYFHKPNKINTIDWNKE